MLQAATIAKVQFAQVPWLYTLGTAPSRSDQSGPRQLYTSTDTAILKDTWDVSAASLAKCAEQFDAARKGKTSHLCVLLKTFLLGLLKIYNLVWFNINFATHDICCVYQSFLPFFILYFCKFCIFVTSNSGLFVFFFFLMQVNK